MQISHHLSTWKWSCCSAMCPYKEFWHGSRRLISSLVPYGDDFITRRQSRCEPEGVTGVWRLSGGLRCTFKEHPLGWKPGFTVFLPPTALFLSSWSEVVCPTNTNTDSVNSCCQAEWMWIWANSYLDAHFLLLTPHCTALTHIHAHTPSMPKGQTEGD